MARMLTSLIFKIFYISPYNAWKGTEKNKTMKHYYVSFDSCFMNHLFKHLQSRLNKTINLSRSRSSFQNAAMHAIVKARLIDFSTHHLSLTCLLAVHAECTALCSHLHFYIVHLSVWVCRPLPHSRTNPLQSILRQKSIPTCCCKWPYIRGNVR